MTQLSSSPMRSPARIHATIWAACFSTIACCALMGCDQGRQGNRNSTDNVKPSPFQGGVYALGRLQPAGGIITIGGIPGDQLAAIDAYVRVGEPIPGDGVLGALSSFEIGTQQLKALKAKRELLDSKHAHELQIAEAQILQAEAALAQAEAQYHELELRGGKLEPLQRGLELAQGEYDRLKALQRDNPELVKDHQLKKQENELKLAEQEYQIVAGSRDKTMAAALAAVDAAKQNRDVAKLTLEQLSKRHDKLSLEQEFKVATATLKRSLLLGPGASISEEDLSTLEFEKKPSGNGKHTVLKVFVRPGDTIGQLPIIQLGDLTEMVCVAEVYETDAGRVSVGQEVTITSRAFGKEFEDGIRGRVIRKGLLVGSPGIANRNPLAPADKSVVEVRIAIEGDSAIKHAAERVGLQVNVEFDEQSDKNPAP